MEFPMVNEPRKSTRLGVKNNSPTKGIMLGLNEQDSTSPRQKSDT